MILKRFGQWAVTEYGIESVVTNRLRGDTYYAIEWARINRDERWVEHMSGKAWVDSSDFRLAHEWALNHKKKAAATRRKEQTVAKSAKVKLFNREGRFGVQTTASTTEEFMSEFSALLLELIGAGYFAENREALGVWQTQAFEVNAKLRGYKADVQEERLIYAGASFVSEQPDVLTTSLRRLTLTPADRPV